ncbi:preprotein translocase subunit SecD [Methanosphaerula palustris]|uniref:Protein-export membrane protein SecD n=1 Tax=Methanosphaerula palustris (strain ATCC BAA-1556 / DSM 19958 / E1-9c) TaxID=521011 RepID=B8GGW6_METPE|nr:SecD/SecF/SecDF export membrane protein [Methanosphaerula palustris E1-9c]
MTKREKIKRNSETEAVPMTRTGKGIDWKALLTDWRVALVLILVVLSVIAIYPHFDSDGKLTTDIQYGLDLQEGAWIQLELKSEVVTFETTNKTADFIAALDKQLDTQVESTGANQLEIRKAFTQDQLTTAFQAAGGKLDTYQQGVTKSTAEDVKRILENKINSLGTKDAKVNTLSGLNGVTQYIRVELAGVDMNTAQEIVGKQGKFEIRINTTDNQSEHVLYGDSITSVSMPSQSPVGSGNWGVGFTLSDAGAAAFRNGSIQYGAVDDPSNHNLVMILDNQSVYSAPLSSDLAAKLRASPSVKELFASTGSGTDGQNSAQNLEIHLRAGALPVDVSVAGSGSVSASLGEHFKLMSILAGLFALITVGLVIFFRYREPLIVLPMIGTNMAEIVILLGIARFTQQLDLATIAGLIAVLGTGIDQLIIITDEVLHEGRVPSPNLYLKRLSRALGIIVISALTVFMAMLPLAVMSLSTLRGFAIITILGVLIGVIITRPAYGRIIMAILSR